MDQEEKEDPSRRSRIPVPKIQRSASFAYGPRSYSSPRESEVKGRNTSLHIPQQRLSLSAKESGNSSYKGLSHSANASPLFPRKPHEFENRAVEEHSDSFSVCSSHTRKSVNRLKFAVHCHGNHDEIEEYLTPTQRAKRTIKTLRAALQEAQAEIRQKDCEIQHLTKELVELRLLRVHSPPETLIASDSSPEDTVKLVPQSEVTLSKSMNLIDPNNYQNVTGCSRSVSVPGRFDDLQPSSLTDSGHYDDLTSPVCRSKESLCTSVLVGIAEEGYDWSKSGVEDFDWNPKQGSVADAALSTDYFDWEDERRIIMKETANKIEQMHRDQKDEIQDLKEKYNNKLEQSLHQLTEANSRYCYILPEVETTRQRLRSAESEIDQLRHDMSSKETRVFDLTKKVNELETSLSDNSVAEIEQLNKLISEAEVRSIGYRQELKAFQEDNLLKNERIKALEQEVSNLKQDVCFKDNEIANLTSKMAGLQRASDEGGEKREYTRQDLEDQLRASVLQLERVKATERSSIATSQGNRDPEMTLKFLRSAVFYLLTDRENHEGHLKAIQSILDFSPLERQTVARATKYWSI